MCQSTSYSNLDSAIPLLAQQVVVANNKRQLGYHLLDYQIFLDSVPVAVSPLKELSVFFLSVSRNKSQND